MRAKKLRVNDKVYEFVTINELSKGSGRSLSQIRKLIERGIMPESNLRMPNVQTSKGPILGARIYTVQLAEKLCTIIKTFKQGIPITKEQKDALNRSFMEEKIFLNL